MIRTLAAALAVVALTFFGVAPAASASSEDPPALTSFAPIDERREYTPGEVAWFSWTVSTDAPVAVTATFVNEDGGRLVTQHGGAGRLGLELSPRASGGTYRLDHVSVWTGLIDYYADGSVTRDGVLQPARHDLDLAGIAFRYVGSTGDSRVPIVTSLRRASTYDGYQTGTTVHLDHVTDEANLRHVMVYFTGPGGVERYIRAGAPGADGFLTADRWPLGTYTPVLVEARDTLGNIANYYPDGHVMRTAGPFSAGLVGGPDRHQLDLDALSFTHVAANPATGRSYDVYRNWDGKEEADLIARSTDGRLFAFTHGWDVFGDRRQIGRGWNGMSLLAQTYGLSGRRVPEVVAVERATGRLLLYPGTGAGQFATTREIGRGWGGMNLLIGVQDWAGRGTFGLVARNAATGMLYYYGADGRGGLRPGVVIGRGWSGMDTIVSAADWDQDGHTDLMARQRATGDLYLYPGNGSGGFVGSRLLSRGSGDYDSFVGAAQWARSGELGLLGRERITGELRVLRPGIDEWWGGSPNAVVTGLGGWTIVG